MRLPVYVPREPRSGRSLQVWIARHRRLLGELKRNGSGTGYRAVYAQEQARARRWFGARLERNEELRNDVLERLKLGWSPETVAGRLKRERGKSVISYESIYRFIYAQSARHKDYGWRHYLRQKRWKRGRRRRRKGHSPASFIAHRRSIAERPAAVANRQTFGNWEADMMQFGRAGQTVLALHERHSRLLIGVRQPFEGSRTDRRGHGCHPGTAAAGVPPDDHVR